MLLASALADLSGDDSEQITATAYSTGPGEIAFADFANQAVSCRGINNFSPNLKFLEDESGTPRRRTGRGEKQISVDPNSLDNSYRKPGNVPFEWEREPGIPKVQVSSESLSGPAPVLQPPPRMLVLNRTSAGTAPSSPARFRRSISGMMRSILNSKAGPPNNIIFDESSTPSSPAAEWLHRNNLLSGQLRRVKSYDDQRHSSRVEPEIFSVRTRKMNGRSSPGAAMAGPDLMFVNRRSNADNTAQPSAAKKESSSGDTACGGRCIFLPFTKIKSKPKTLPAELDTISMEKFRCGDSNPGSICDEEESIRVCVESPEEFIRYGWNEVFSPVSTAFVFDGDRQCPPSVLKKTKSRHTRKPSRHVRFSVDAPSSSSSTSSCSSSPSSKSATLTPRLRRAREEFNACLEAAARSTPQAEETSIDSEPLN